MPDQNAPVSAQAPVSEATPSEPATSPATPAPKGESAEASTWLLLVGHLKNIKEVLAAIAAIAAAIAFALNYFATSRALDCFKTEARNSNELVQTVLQINDLTASWQLTTLKLRQLDHKSKAPNVAPDSSEYEGILKDVVATQSQIDDITKNLNAARDRKILLERSAKTCD